jgi:hypothetical protein
VSVADSATTAAWGTGGLAATAAASDCVPVGLGIETEAGPGSSAARDPLGVDGCGGAGGSPARDVRFRRTESAPPSTVGSDFDDVREPLR